MTAMTHRMLTIVLLFTLVGCASDGEPGALYLLAQSPAPPAETAGAAGVQPVLVVEDVVLAPYLASAGIVYQTRPNQIVIADNNRWAAPLKSQLADGLYDALSGGLTGVDTRRSGRAPARPGYRLIVHVNRFQGRYDGVAVIAGNWRLFNPEGEVVGRDRFERNTPLKTDGYSALVRALSRGWRYVKQAMAQRIAKAIATP